MFLLHSQSTTADGHRHGRRQQLLLAAISVVILLLSSLSPSLAAETTSTSPDSQDPIVPTNLKKV